MSKNVFEYWLELQLHKWQQQQRRVAAINKLRGYDLDTPDFPVEYDKESGTINIIGRDMPLCVNDSDEFIDFVGSIIWGDKK